MREIPFLGNRACKKLILEFNTPENILSAPETELRRVKGISKKIIEGIKNQSRYKKAALRELKAVAENCVKIATLDQKSYPPLLKLIPDPPPVITYLGRFEDSNSRPCLSIVGSRNATSYGMNTSRHLSGQLVRAGFTIVSGMARGIDSAAHQGALAGQGKTIAVLGSGLKKIYPRENQVLFSKICENGAVISEFKLDTEPLGRNFPVRNRIIAGLSLGTIVVEAEKRSGSLITARLAGEFNREVFAVPGSIRSRRSEGTHALLKQGAKLVENEMDILDELHQFVHVQSPETPVKAKKNKPRMDKVECIIYKMLDPYPRHIDRIVETSRLESGKVLAALLDLELKGLVLRHPGNYYSISEE
ncbi:DNA-processing protein DprA [Desulfospira joergensenii]|uniref:DNA-processing protein DprA n=1 Tax=Desulfospira joergensenii TaxID=53329 RepID=UPI001FC97AC0|nr:DNA-processing protein DprA [Desulfospira joergensenii]